MHFVFVLTDRIDFKVTIHSDGPQFDSPPSTFKGSDSKAFMSMSGTIELLVTRQFIKFLSHDLKLFAENE